MLIPRALIITGDGINCERETAEAFTLAGAESTILHVNDWLARPRQMFDYQLLALPGGFSFADYLGAGQVLALKIKHHAFDELQEFATQARGIIGICNGLQILLRLGLLPGPQQETSITLDRNQGGTFIDRWVPLQRQPHSTCWWTQQLPHHPFHLPIRHGEGRFVFADSWQEQGVATLASRGQIALEYCHDENGSAGRIAGICNPRGNILGLMPHPEAAIKKGASPLSSSDDSLGLALFKSAVELIKNS